MEGFSVSRMATLAPDLFTLSLLGVSLVVAASLYWLLFLLGPAEIKGKPAIQLCSSSLSRQQVASCYQTYASFFRQPRKIDSPDRVPEIINTYYNLITDIMEWGWGQSFHFSSSIAGKSHSEETRMHEVRVADLLHIKPGDKVLDAGCGVGGPMRAIASYSGATVIGITINEYQVQRARSHNSKAGLSGLCQVFCGNFLQMPFPDGTFDAAYSIEATCHAPKLRDVYAEIYRVLKPGKLYMTYEWVTTPKHRPENEEHAEIMHGIERGSGLPGCRSYKQIVEAAKEVGFEVLMDKDMALPPAGPWWARLKTSRLANIRNRIVINVLSFIHITPPGLREVHDMLFRTSDYLTRGGEAGIFTPMHVLVCRKPETSQTTQ